MAEIYKQQVEHNATTGPRLRTPTFKNYVAQGLDNVNRGFDQLDEYISYFDDKILAGAMDSVKNEAVNDIANWKDFNTDGRAALIDSIMGKYDAAMAAAPYDAQKRFDVANPDARKIFELKVKEQVLKKANEQVYAEKQRDFGAFADIVSNIQDPVSNEKMFRATLDEINKNEGDMLSVKQVGELVDSAGHDIALQTINQAIVEGRDKDAETYLNNSFYTRFLGPTEKSRLQREVASLRKSLAEDKANGGNYTDVANLLITGRDAAMAVYGTTQEGRLAVDEDYSKFVRALKNGESMKGLTMGGRPFADFLTENNLKAMDYWDSLPMTTRQLAANKYEETMRKAFGDDYTDRQSYLAKSLNTSLAPYVDSDGVVDLSKVPNNDRSEIRAQAMELRGLRNGLSSSQQKVLDNVVDAFAAERYEAGKSISAELNSVQQNMAGMTSGKTFLGGGNLTEAMIRAKQYEEEPISVIDAMLDNSVSSINEELGDAARRAGTFLSGEKLGRFGWVLGTRNLAPVVSDFSDVLDDGSIRNAEAIAASVGSLMEQLGEVDEKGKLVVPKANTYRFMTYAIPVILTYISVNGNEQDLQNTGIKRGAINNVHTVDMVYAMQDMYRARLDEAIESSTDIKKSEFYDMLLVGLDIAKQKGFANVGQEPNQNSISGLASVLQDLAEDAPAKVYIPAKDSGARKRIEAKTKPMLRFKGVDNE